MWHLYIVQCANGAYYTGITTDVKRRLAEHAAGRGARYTRAFKAVKLVHIENFRTQSNALKREAAIKKLSRTQKLALIKKRKLWIDDELPLPLFNPLRGLGRWRACAALHDARSPRGKIEENGQGKSPSLRKRG
jgi:putative endonuclease